MPRADRIQQRHERQTAWLAFENTWRHFAPKVDDARRVGIEVQQSPSELADRWVDAQVKFLIVFEKDIQACEAIYAGGKHLPTKSLRNARDAVARLDGTFEKARAATARNAERASQSLS